jgi:hypothetical protein
MEVRFAGFDSGFYGLFLLVERGFSSLAIKSFCWYKNVLKLWFIWAKFTKHMLLDCGGENFSSANCKNPTSSLKY